MGKWDSANLHPKFEIVAKYLESLPKDVITKRWEELGSPLRASLGLQWYWGSSGGGWACVDDSAVKKPCRFKKFFNRQQVGCNEEYLDYCMQLCCVIYKVMETIELVESYKDEDNRLETDCPNCKLEVPLINFTDSEYSMDADQCPVCGHTLTWQQDYTEDMSNSWWAFYWDPVRTK